MLNFKHKEGLLSPIFKLDHILDKIKSLAHSPIEFDW